VEAVHLVQNLATDLRDLDLGTARKQSDHFFGLDLS
jgi:hypothetical protein